VSERNNGGLLFARVLGFLGRTMITAGVLILLFVAYQLWGTSIRTAQAQDALEDDLAATLEAAEAEGAVVGSTTTSTTSTTLDPTLDPTASTPTTSDRLPPTTAAPLPPELLPADGEAAGQLVIPEIGVDWVYVEGVSVSDLKKGPGHYPETPMPGQAGNAAIAGHRTTYGQPFHNLDQLQPGDLVEVTTVQGDFTYEVRATIIVRPTQVEVLGSDFWDFDEDPTTLHDTLTLTACHPKFSARERIVVAAELVGEPAPPTPRAGDDARPRPDAPTEFEADLSGERAGAAPAVAWAAVCAGIWLLAWAVGRRKRKARWPAYAIALLPFLVALFLFFENFSRLLPANY
jgi:sortase A